MVQTLNCHVSTDYRSIQVVLSSILLQRCQSFLASVLHEEVLKRENSDNFLFLVASFLSGFTVFGVCLKIFKPY